MVLDDICVKSYYQARGNPYVKKCMREMNKLGVKQIKIINAKNESKMLLETQ